MLGEDSAKIREVVTKAAVANIPRGFLEEVNETFPLAYRDIFEQIRQDGTTLQQKRPWRLYQDRHFRLEWELSQAATRHGLDVTSNPLPENGYKYTYVAAGQFGLTQQYIQHVGALPKPAKYREELAKAALAPRLPLDDPEEIYTTKEFYGLIAHTPIGRTFTHDKQKLGYIGLCVPYPNMDGWAFQLSIPELLAYYPAKAASKKRASSGPRWKRDQKDNKSKGKK